MNWDAILLGLCITVAVGCLAWILNPEPAEERQLRREWEQYQRDQYRGGQE